MTTAHWQSALWTLSGVPILLAIGWALVKIREHGDRARAKKRLQEITRRSDHERH